MILSLFGLAFAVVLLLEVSGWKPRRRRKPAVQPFSRSRYDQPDAITLEAWGLLGGPAEGGHR